MAQLAERLVCISVFIREFKLPSTELEHEISKPVTCTSLMACLKSCFFSLLKVSLFYHESAILWSVTKHYFSFCLLLLHPWGTSMWLSGTLRNCAKITQQGYLYAFPSRFVHDLMHVNVTKILKCGFIAVFKRSVEDDGTLFAVYAGYNILQFNIVNMPEVVASEAKHANP